MSVDLIAHVRLHLAYFTKRGLKEHGVIATITIWKTLTKLGVATVALFISAPHVCAADVAVLSTTTTAMGADPVCNVRLSGQ